MVNQRDSKSATAAKYARMSSSVCWWPAAAKHHASHHVNSWHHVPPVNASAGARGGDWSEVAGTAGTPLDKQKKIPWKWTYRPETLVLHWSRNCAQFRLNRGVAVIGMGLVFETSMQTGPAGTGPPRLPALSVFLWQSCSWLLDVPKMARGIETYRNKVRDWAAPSKKIKLLMQRSWWLVQSGSGISIGNEASANQPGFFTATAQS